MINRHPSNCRCCVSPATEPLTGPEPIALPDKPTPIRVHSAHWPPQDCTLHPDGRMTMQAHGQTLTSMLSFDDMRETSWAQARIEWDPPPLPVDPEPEPGPAAVQDAIPFG